jgi:uncharacterized membrane protein YphA (DoxX/SURF4 family)/vacuolar-type H+-ATPase subunit H
MLVRRVARPLLSAVFIGQGVEALREPDRAAETARPTAEGLQKLPPSAASKVPKDPMTLARVTAGVQIGGGLLLATGRLPRLASAALAATVVPGSLGGHLFWTETDPQRKTQQRREFLTDLSLLGGLMIASVDTEGKPSLGWRGRRAAKRASEAVAAALPVGATSSGALLDTVGEKVTQGLHTGAERGRELADVAGERVSPLLDAARDRGSDLAETARKRGKKAAKKAQKRAEKVTKKAQKRADDISAKAQKRADDISAKAQRRAEQAAQQAQQRFSEQFA